MQIVSCIVAEALASIGMVIVIVQGVVGCVPVRPFVITVVARYVWVVVLLLIQVIMVVWVGSTV